MRLPATSNTQTDPLIPSRPSSLSPLLEPLPNLPLFLPLFAKTASIRTGIQMTSLFANPVYRISASLHYLHMYMQACNTSIIYYYIYTYKYIYILKALLQRNRERQRDRDRNRRDDD